jgi:hypothetical protein
MTVTVEIVGVPVACGERVKDSWREIASWVARELERAFGDSVRVQYHDLFEAGCPVLPADAKLPVVLIDGEPIPLGAKISLPAIRKALTSRGVAAVCEASASRSPESIASFSGLGKESTR